MTEIKRITQGEGKLALYKGFWATFWRDVPAWGAFFYSYEFLKKKLGVYKMQEENDPNKMGILMRQLLAGGIAGDISWFVSYPFDLLKTHI